MDFLDDQSLALGRYSRAARFPVVPPDLTYVAYGHEFAELFALLPEGLRKFELVIRNMLFDMIEQMMSLPAASTHHHRTAGGLFFHSFEVGVIAAERAISEGKDDRTILASMIAGFLHDIGKSVSLFKVSKLDRYATASIDELMGEPRLPDVIWNPNETILADWCADQEVEYLALEFLKRPRIGHIQEGATLWRALVPEALGHVIEQDPKLHRALTHYLDGKYEVNDLRSRVAAADLLSIQRDLNPTVRTQPKRSDMHLVRRFIEFIYLAPWNSPKASFMNCTLPGQAGDEAPQPLPFFVATPHNIYKFLDYVQSEDLYGHVIPEQWWDVMPVLEAHGVLRREAPNGEWQPRPCPPEKYAAPVLVEFLINSLSPTPNQPVPLCYCPYPTGAVPHDRFGALKIKTQNPF